MTNQEKFIQIFGIDAWQQMIVFSGLAVNFKEYWTMSYNEMDCRDCKEFEDCPCGKNRHESGTSQGYSIGECKDFELLESDEICLIPDTEHERTNFVIFRTPNGRYVRYIKCEMLDKIRAEIECLTITEGGNDYTRKMAELCSLKLKVLQIIDKYKEENEC